MEGYVTVPLGSMDDSPLRSEVAIFTRNRKPWDRLDTDIPCFEDQPAWTPESGNHAREEGRPVTNTNRGTRNDDPERQLRMWRFIRKDLPMPPGKFTVRDRQFGHADMRL